MHPQTYKLLSYVEDRHWWYKSRLKLAAHYINKCGINNNARILDVGCGTGGTTRFLEQYGEVTGIEKSELALQYARGKSHKTNFMEGDANDIDKIFPDNHFDLIVFFNTLYHKWVDDDLLMLTKARNILRPGGHILLTDSAFKILTRRHDILDMGKTRYTLSDFKRYFSLIDMRYKFGRYFNAVSFPACLLLAIKDKFVNTDIVHDDVNEFFVPPKIINESMIFYMNIENLFMKWVPLGVNLLAVGQKK